jgi:hypothetical protein
MAYWKVDATIVAEFDSMEEAAQAYEDLPEMVEVNIGETTVQVPKSSISVEEEP